MRKLRVYELARELELDNAELIRELQHMGVPVTSHSNTVEDRIADQLRRRLAPAPPPPPPPPPPPAPVEEEETAVTAPPPPVEEARIDVAPPEPVTAEMPKPEPAEVEAAPAIQPQFEAPAEVVEAPVTAKPPAVAEVPKIEVAPAPEVKRVEAPPEPKVAHEPAPPPSAPPPPAAPLSAHAPAHPPLPPRVEARIIPPSKLPAPKAPPKKPVEERKTMQQIVSERLRQSGKLPPALPPRPGLPPRKPGEAPLVPRLPRPGVAPIAEVPREPRRDDRHDRARADRLQRFDRPVPKKLETPPAVRPMPKPVVPREFRKITMTEGLTVKDIAEKLDIRSKDLIKKLMDRGVFATINQTLDNDMVREVCKDFNAEVEFLTLEEKVTLDLVESSTPEKLVPRPPVVTIMGHVDHGKTSLLDAIRKSRVTEQEAGGITQHIGAYQVEAHDRRITFLDTPGHEAFTLMRARGAKVTDIVVLVVAADDGVMPQTLESIAHTKAAKVPIIVAINKIDKPEANVERVKRELSEHGLLAEDWGGDTVMVEVSAKKGTNLQQLLEMILLVADIQAVKADPTCPAVATVLEAKIDKGRGNVASVLVQHGTLNVGDNFIVGTVVGKVRAMFDAHGNPVKDAGPSTPVEVLGLQGLPMAGDSFQVMTDIAKLRQIGSFRQEKQRETALAKSARLTLDQLHKQLVEGNIKEVPLILKADVQGSVEALTDMLNKLSTDKVKVRIMHGSVGAISETDVLLGAASNAIIVGFNVRPERKAADLANREQVDIRLHTIVYNVTDEIKRAMVGVLEPVVKETYLGTADVRNTFRIPKVGTVAGCYITDGRITRNAEVRLLRDNVVVYEGKISSLRRFKDDASEVRIGYECGIGLQNFNDVKIGDAIEAFVSEKVAADVGVSG